MKHGIVLGYDILEDRVFFFFFNQSVFHRTLFPLHFQGYICFSQNNRFSEPHTLKRERYYIFWERERLFVFIYPLMSLPCYSYSNHCICVGPPLIAPPWGEDQSTINTFLDWNNFKIGVLFFSQYHDHSSLLVYPKKKKILTFWNIYVFPFCSLMHNSCVCVYCVIYINVFWCMHTHMYPFISTNRMFRDDFSVETSIHSHGYLCVCLSNFDFIKLWIVKAERISNTGPVII